MRDLGPFLASQTGRLVVLRDAGNAKPGPPRSVSLEVKPLPQPNFQRLLVRTLGATLKPRSDLAHPNLMGSAGARTKTLSRV